MSFFGVLALDLCEMVVRGLGSCEMVVRGLGS